MWQSWGFQHVCGPPILERTHDWAKEFRLFKKHRLAPADILYSHDWIVQLIFSSQKKTTIDPKNYIRIIFHHIYWKGELKTQNYFDIQNTLEKLKKIDKRNFAKTE